MAWNDMVYGDFKCLTRQTVSDKYCIVNHLILLKIPNVMDINLDLLQWFTNVLNASDSGATLG